VPFNSTGESLLNSHSEKKMVAGLLAVVQVLEQMLDSIKGEVEQYRQELQKVRE
jgi:hypothetical protein